MTAPEPIAGEAAQFRMENARPPADERLCPPRHRFEPDHRRESLAPSWAPILLGVGQERVPSHEPQFRRHRSRVQGGVVR